MRLMDYRHLTLDRDRPVVFLDIDGVLNGGFQHEHLETYYKDCRLIERPSFRGDYVLAEPARVLSELLARYRAQVVIVSSWFRQDVGAGDPQVEELRALFDMDVLGSLSTTGCVQRGVSVADCIQSARLRDWAIVDDCGHFYQDDRLPISRIVTPSGRYGLQPQEMETLALLLGTLTT